MRKSRKYSSLAIERPEIAAQWDYENNEMTPDEVTAGSGYKVAWICEKGHRWRAAIGDRCKYNNGCPYCSGRFAITGENDLATLYPKIAKEWDCESNGDVRPDNIKPFGAKTYHWKCSNGHKYKASIASRTKMGLGCPYCSGHRAIPGETDVLTLYPELIPLWDYHKTRLTPIHCVRTAVEKCGGNVRYSTHGKREFPTSQFMVKGALIAQASGCSMVSMIWKQHFRKLLLSGITKKTAI